MSKQAQADLIVEIGEAIVEDQGSAAQNWQVIAVTSTFEDDGQTFKSYWFDAEGKYSVLQLADAFDLMERIEDLRDEMIGDGDRPWVQCLMSISQPEFKFSIQYEYEDPDRWPASKVVAEMSERARSLSQA